MSTDKVVINTQAWTKVIILACIYGKELMRQCLLESSFTATEKAEMLKRLDRMIIR